MKITLVFAPLALAAVAAPVGLTVFADRLPGQVDVPGGAEEPVSTALWVGLSSGWILVAFGLLGHRVRRSGCVDELRRVAALAWAAGVGTLLHQAGVLSTSLDREWPGSDMPWWSSLWAIGAIAIVSGGLGWLVVGGEAGGPRVTQPPDAAAPRRALPPDARAMWARSLFCTAPVTTAVLLGALSTGGILLDGPGLGDLIVAVLAVYSAAHGWVRVRLDDMGITVVQPLLRNQLIKVPADQVALAGADHDDARMTQGPRRGLIRSGPLLGYRTRSHGQVLRIELSGGRRFVLTVDRPEVPAGLLNSLIDRQRTPIVAEDRPC